MRLALPQAGSLPRFASWLLSEIAVAVLLAVGVVAIALNLYLQTLRGVQEHVLSQTTRQTAPVSPGLAAGPNFVGRLPGELDLRFVVAHLQTSCNANQVTLESVATWQAAPTLKTFGRIGFSVDLKGSYPQLKAVIGDALDRNPDIVIKAANFKRRAQPTDVQAHVEFIALVRPQSLRPS